MGQYRMSVLEQHKANLIVYDLKIARLQRMAKQLEEQGVTSVPTRDSRYPRAIKNPAMRRRAIEVKSSLPQDCRYQFEVEMERLQYDPVQQNNMIEWYSRRYGYRPEHEW